MQPQIETDPEVIELIRVRGKILIVLGTVILLFFGIIAIRGVIVGAIDPLTVGTRIIGSIIGFFFTGLGLLFLSRWPQLLFGNRALIVGSAGIALRDRFGPTFSVAWADIATIRVTHGYKTTRTGQRVLVRLDWWPTQAPGSSLPRGLKKIWHRPATPDRFRLPMGPNEFLISPVDQALVRFAGNRYRPVEDSGAISGWQLT